MARSGGRDQAGFSARGQRVDHHRRVFTMFWQRPAEGVADGRRIGAGGYGAVVDCGKKCLSVLDGSAEAGGAVRHVPTLRHVRLAAISSNAAMVENSLAESAGAVGRADDAGLGGGMDVAQVGEHAGISASARSPTTLRTERPFPLVLR